MEAPERAGCKRTSYPPTFSITASQTRGVIGAESPQLEVQGLHVECFFEIIFPGECVTAARVLFFMLTPYGL